MNLIQVASSNLKLDCSWKIRFREIEADKYSNSLSAVFHFWLSNRNTSVNVTLYPTIRLDDQTLYQIETDDRETTATIGYS